jgi:hypothetical protein
VVVTYVISTFNAVCLVCNMGSRWAYDTACIFQIINFGICSLCIETSLIRYCTFSFKDFVLICFLFQYLAIRKLDKRNIWYSNVWDEMVKGNERKWDQSWIHFTVNNDSEKADNSNHVGWWEFCNLNGKGKQMEQGEIYFPDKVNDCHIKHWQPYKKMSLKKHMPSTLSELQLQLNLLTKEAFPSHMHISQ